MEKDLSKYFEEIDHLLGRVDFLKRQEFLNSFQSKVFEYFDKNPDADIEDVWAKFYTPSKVAQNFIKDNGLKVSLKKSNWSFGRVFFYTMALACFTFILSLFILFKFFSPLFSIDEGKIKLLGGQVVLNDMKDFNVSVGSPFPQVKEVFELNKDIKVIDFKFNRGEFYFSNHARDEITYDCMGLGKVDIQNNGSTVEVYLDNSFVTSCDLYFPKNLDLKVRLEEGKINMKELHNNVDVDLSNGEIEFQVDSQIKYNYELSVKDGSIDDFINSNESDAFKVKMNVSKGSIKK